MAKLHNNEVGATGDVLLRLCQQTVTRVKPEQASVVNLEWLLYPRKGWNGRKGRPLTLQLRASNAKQEKGEAQ